MVATYFIKKKKIFSINPKFADIRENYNHERKHKPSTPPPLQFRSVSHLINIDDSNLINKRCLITY